MGEDGHGTAQAAAVPRPQYPHLRHTAGGDSICPPAPFAVLQGWELALCSPINMVIVGTPFMASASVHVGGGYTKVCPYNSSYFDPIEYDEGTPFGKHALRSESERL